MYARESGRHATLHYVPTMIRKGQMTGCWIVRFTLKSDDPRMRLYQKGEMAEPPTEDVWLHKRVGGAEKWGEEYEPLNIVELGPSGVRTFLEKGNLWSGRGDYDGLVDQLAKVNEMNETARQKNYDDARFNAKKRAMDKRRSRLKIPFLGVGTDLKGSKPKEK